MCTPPGDARDCNKVCSENLVGGRKCKKKNLPFCKKQTQPLCKNHCRILLSRTERSHLGGVECRPATFPLYCNDFFKVQKCEDLCEEFVETTKAGTKCLTKEKDKTPSLCKKDIEFTCSELKQTTKCSDFMVKRDENILCFTQKPDDCRGYKKPLCKDYCKKHLIVSDGGKCKSTNLKSHDQFCNEYIGNIPKCPDKEDICKEYLKEGKCYLDSTSRPCISFFKKKGEKSCADYCKAFKDEENSCKKEGAPGFCESLNGLENCGSGTVTAVGEGKPAESKEDKSSKCSEEGGTFREEDEKCCESKPWREGDYAGGNGKINESEFCGQYAGKTSDCKKAIKRMRGIFKHMNRLGDMEQRLEEDKFNLTMESYTEDDTEAEANCEVCDRITALKELYEPSASQKFGSFLGIVGGTALSYFGLREARKAATEANDLRAWQGLPAENNFAYNLAGITAGFPFIRDGIYGMTNGNQRRGAAGCSQTANHYPRGPVMYQQPHYPTPYY